jgi:flagellar protein FliO/FliZ
VDELFTVLRVIVSLAVVVGVIWFVQKKYVKSGGRKSRQCPVTVVARQNVGGKTSVAVIEFQGKQLLIGVTEHGISVLDSSTLEAVAEVETATELNAESVSAALAKSVQAGAAVAQPVAVKEPTVTAVRPYTRRGSSKQFAAVLAGLEPMPSSLVAPVVAEPTTAKVASKPALTRTPIPAALHASLKRRPPETPLGGSILSGATWKQAFAAIKGDR